MLLCRCSQEWPLFWKVPILSACSPRIGSAWKYVVFVVIIRISPVCSSMFQNVRHFGVCFGTLGMLQYLSVASSTLWTWLYISGVVNTLRHYCTCRWCPMMFGEFRHVSVHVGSLGEFQHCLPPKTLFSEMWAKCLMSVLLLHVGPKAQQQAGN